MLESSYYLVYQSYGFNVVSLVGENLAGNPPSTANLQTWVNYFSLQYVVLADPYWTIGVYYNPTDFFIPYHWVVDQELIIRGKNLDLNSLQPIIEDLLGI